MGLSSSPVGGGEEDDDEIVKVIVMEWERLPLLPVTVMV